MIILKREEVTTSQKLPGGLTLSDLGLRYSKHFNALMLHTPYIPTVYRHENRKVVYIPFYINQLPVWHHISKKDSHIEVYDLW